LKLSLKPLNTSTAPIVRGLHSGVVADAVYPQSP
jgi:hypothetical protein